MTEYDRQYTRKEILENIREVSNKYGRAPTMEEYRDDGIVSVETVENKFGTWNEALNQAGVAEREKYDKRDVDIERVIELYLDKGLSLSEISKEFGVGVNVIKDRLRRYNIPTDLPNNVRYLMFNGPTPINDLPNEITTDDKIYGVSKFKISGGIGVSIAYLEEDTRPFQIVKKYIEYNRDDINREIEKGNKKGLVERFGYHGKEYREAAKKLLQ